MTNELIDIRIGDPTADGSVDITICNLSDRPIIARHLTLQGDFHIATKEGQAARPFLSSSFGVGVPDLNLGPGEAHKVTYNLLKWFVFPCAGVFEVWIDYESSGQTAAWDRSHKRRVKARAISNVVRINVNGK